MYVCNNLETLWLIRCIGTQHIPNLGRGDCTKFPVCTSGSPLYFWVWLMCRLHDGQTCRVVVVLGGFAFGEQYGMPGQQGNRAMPEGLPHQHIAVTTQPGQNIFLACAKIQIWDSSPALVHTGVKEFNHVVSGFRLNSPPAHAQDLKPIFRIGWT